MATSQSSIATSGPVTLSAQGLHEVAVQAFRVGNRGRLSLCEALRGLSETRLYLDLGFPSISAYADAFFQLRRAETFEYVRVARALVELTALRDAFGRGRLSWSVLKAVTRVASVSSQESWLEFVREHGTERTLAEARDALRRDRDSPRDASFGLPNLDQRLVLRFSRSDMDKVRGWIEGTCAEVAASTGADEVSLEQAVLFLCEQDAVSARPAGDLNKDEDTKDPKDTNERSLPARSASHRAQVVYQHCPGCRKARVGTRDGFVEVASSEVERYEGSAEWVVIDGPTPRGLRRRIVAREAGRCGNPRCHHRAEHCHHIVFRSRGGATSLDNEVAVCTTCHALIHAGLLRVSGSACGELRWLPAALGESFGRASAAGGPMVEQLPVLQVLTDPACRRGASERRVESAYADSAMRRAGRAGLADATCGVNREDLADGLRRLGVPVRRAGVLIDAAIASLPRAEITEGAVLRRAIASI